MSSGKRKKRKRRIFIYINMEKINDADEETMLNWISGKFS